MNLKIYALPFPYGKTQYDPKHDLTKAGRGSRRRIGPGISHRRYSHSNVNKATKTSRVSNLGILLYSFLVYSYYCFSKAKAENAAGFIASVAKISVIFALDLKSGRGGAVGAVRRT
jgi:hypothetical protein